MRARERALDQLRINRLTVLNERSDRETQSALQPAIYLGSIVLPCAPRLHDPLELLLACEA